MSKLTPQDFEAAGYHRFNSKQWREYAAYGLQKRFDDERGKKYFIEVYVYDNRDLMQRGHPGPEFSWEAELHVSSDGTERYDRLQFWGQYESLDEFHAHADRFWEFAGKPYYELFDE